jgi:superfamily II DNA or RNA helicase
VELELDDRRHVGIPLLFAQPVELRDYQEPMCSALLEGQCGVVEAPTAAGKTAVTLEAIRRAGRNALVIVEKSSLAKQWMDAVQRFLGIDVGYIGEGSYRLGPITIALRQALYARKDEFLANGFFSRWGTVVVDEAHHSATAWSLIELIQMFTSLNRWGVTATPDRDPEYFPVLQAVIGPVLWETTMRDAAEHLVIPRVRVLETEFIFDYHPTGQYVNDAGRIQKVRNNYNEMMAALCEDSARNLLIADRIVREVQGGHHVLVISDRKNHLLKIGKLLEGLTFPIHLLTGNESGDRSLEIRDEIYKAPRGTVLLSTVAKEGLSVDRLDRVIAAYPRRNAETMRQIAGRIMRPWPGKEDAVIIDVRDGQQPLLRSQFSSRAQLLYGREQWKIEHD